MGEIVHSKCARAPRRMGRRVIRLTPRLALMLFLLASPGSSSVSEAQSADYVLGPRDVLAITIWDQVDLSGKFTVEPDGTFTFPLVGKLTAGGRTAGARTVGARTASSRTAGSRGGLAGLTALLELDSPFNVLGLLVLLAGAAASGAAVPGEKGSAWTRAVLPGRLRCRRLLAAAGMVVGLLLFVI